LPTSVIFVVGLLFNNMNNIIDLTSQRKTPDVSYVIRGGTSARIRQLIKIERKIAELEADRAELIKKGRVSGAAARMPAPKGAVPILDHLRKRFPEADGYTIRFRAQTVRIHLQKTGKPVGWMRSTSRNPVNAALPADIDAVLTPEFNVLLQKGGK